MRIQAGRWTSWGVISEWYHFQGQPVLLYGFLFGRHALFGLCLGFSDSVFESFSFRKRDFNVWRSLNEKWSSLIWNASSLVRYCFNLILSPHFLASRKCVVECFEFNIHINLDRNVLSNFSKKFLISNAKASLERETLMCSSWSKEDTRNSFSLKTITVFDNPTLIFQCCRCRPISTTKGVLHGRSSLIGAFLRSTTPRPWAI